MKNCNQCHKEKELIEFYVNKKMSDGHLNKCKECFKQCGKNNKDKVNAYRKVYYQKNKEKSVKYYLDNREKRLKQIKEYNENNKDKNKQYRLDNKDKITLQKKINYETNKENNKGRYAESMKEYYINNKQKMLEYQKEYRKAKKLNTINNSTSSKLKPFL